MIITETVVGFMFINIVIYCSLLFIGKKISDSSDSFEMTSGISMVIILIVMFIGTFFSVNYGAKYILATIFSWLNQFSALQLFFIFFFPLIISVPIFYLFSKPSYSIDTRLTIHLKEIKVKISNYKDRKNKNKSKKLEDKKNKLKIKEREKTKALESKLEDKKNKLKTNEMEKTKTLELKIENILFEFAAKNNGIIMKSEIFDITKKYQKRDVMSVIDKLKQEKLIEPHDNSYMFLTLV